MADFIDREDRQAKARAEYERIMTTPSPDPTGAYIESGVIGFVFGEMWRRGVLTARDRRFITLSCVAAAGAITPIETHSYAALASGDVTYAEYDEFVLFFGTQLGWPKASVMTMYGMMAAFKLAEEREQPLEQHDFEPWVHPADDDTRRQRGEAAYLDVHGVPSPPATTAFRGRGYRDYLYGEIWTRSQHLTRRDRRIVSICCAGAAGIEEEATEHLRAALAAGDLTYEELQELVFHYAIYLGWLPGRRLDDLLVGVARDAGLEPS
jgi:4-carboxymuconolactone decarboxylase